MQHSVNARDACSYEHFCVRDHVLPLDAQYDPQTFCMEVVLESLLLTSTSMLASLERVLPR